MTHKPLLRIRRVRNNWYIESAGSIPTRLPKYVYVTFTAIVCFGCVFKVAYDIGADMQAYAYAEQHGFISPIPSPTPAPQIVYQPKYVTITAADNRSARLQKYLTAKHSPLAPYAALIVSAADKHDIGWTKIVAISAIESTYGKNLSGAYNAWNIMEFEGGKRIGARNFSSWEQGIEAVSSLLSRSYRQNEVKAVQLKYCPSFECSENWVSTVLSTTDQILEID